MLAGLAGDFWLPQVIYYGEFPDARPDRVSQSWYNPVSITFFNLCRQLGYNRLVW
jgi:hypothetical protein